MQARQGSTHAKRKCLGVRSITSRNSATSASGLFNDAKPAALARVDDIRSLLHGHKFYMRERAIRVFFVLEEEVISLHVEGIVGMLTDSEWLVRDVLSCLNRIRMQ